MDIKYILILFALIIEMKTEWVKVSSKRDLHCTGRSSFTGEAAVLVQTLNHKVDRYKMIQGNHRYIVCLITRCSVAPLLYQNTIVREVRYPQNREGLRTSRFINTGTGLESQYPDPVCEWKIFGSVTTDVENCLEVYSEYSVRYDLVKMEFDDIRLKPHCGRTPCESSDGIGSFVSSIELGSILAVDCVAPLMSIKAHIDHKNRLIKPVDNHFKAEKIMCKTSLCNKTYWKTSDLTLVKEIESSDLTASLDDCSGDHFNYIDEKTELLDIIEDDEVDVSAKMLCIMVLIQDTLEDIIRDWDKNVLLFNRDVSLRKILYCKKGDLLYWTSLQDGVDKVEMTEFQGGVWRRTCNSSGVYKEFYNGTSVKLIGFDGIKKVSEVVQWSLSVQEEKANNQSLTISKTNLLTLNKDRKGVLITSVTIMVLSVVSIILIALCQLRACVISKRPTKATTVKYIKPNKDGEGLIFNWN